MVISVEDIGFGDKYAPLIIQSLKNSVNEMDSAHLERELFAVEKEHLNKLKTKYLQVLLLFVYALQIINVHFF